jgi:chromosome segregation ATPase
MGKESLADRIKNGPLTPRWKQVVAKNKEISDLKGDIDGPVADYDKNLKQASDANDKLTDAWNGVSGAITTAIAEKNKTLDAHDKALQKLRKDADGTWTRLTVQANKLHHTDVAGALDVVSKLADSNDNYIQQANEMSKDIIDAWQTFDDSFNKAYGDARKTVDGLEADKKKLEDDCNKLDDTIEKTITDMQKQAIRSKQDKVADALGGFLKSL